VNAVEHMQVSTLALPGNMRNWHLVPEYMRLRKSVFIDRMAWPLSVHDGLEFEQYDSFRAVYVIAHHGDQVLGGARLLPTDHEVGNGRYVYSYMIRDASRGLLPGLPANLCTEPPPVRPTTWELTRLVARGRTHVGAAVLNAVNTYLRAIGAKECLFLAPPLLSRMAERMGFGPRSLGPILVNGQGSFHVFACDVR
jgi:acyl homoserine lactone synthase